MKSQLDLTTGMRGHIFSTDLHFTVCFFLHKPKGPLTRNAFIEIMFPLIFFSFEWPLPQILLKDI